MRDSRHQCAQAGCYEDATYVVVEGHPLAMLAQSGAALVCPKHAKDYAAVGGIAMSLAWFYNQSAAAA